MSTLAMATYYPAITPDEYTEACKQLERLCKGRLEGSDWIDIKWTGKALQIQQSRKGVPIAATQLDDGNKLNEIEEVDKVPCTPLLQC